MKKLILMSVAFALALGASAQHRESHNILEKLIWNEEHLNIMLDTRFDLNTTITNGDVDALSFNGQSLKVWFAGEIVPGIRYRVRHRLNKPQTPLTRDNLSGATDHAWIAFDLGKNWTLTAGKQSVQLGTYEYDYSPADIYLGSMVYNDFDGYKVGVDAVWKFLGQTLHFQVVNSDSPQFANEEHANKALAGSVLWEGNLFNGVLKTRWAYSAFQHSDSKFYQWVTAGTQLNVGNFTTELDYYLGDRTMDYSSLVGLGAENRHVRDQSAGLNLKYSFGRWHPFIKGVWNERRDQLFDEKAYQNWGVQGVVEFYPFQREVLKDLRFHLMYSYNQTDFKGQFSELESLDTHSILFGMRWLFKVK